VSVVRFSKEGALRIAVFAIHGNVIEPVEGGMRVTQGRQAGLVAVRKLVLSTRLVDDFAREAIMAHALKLQVHVGKDHLVRLPSDFPEGPAEIVVTAVELPAAASGGALGLWSEVPDGEYESFEGTLQSLRQADRLRTTDE
jgi:hypothetical protein